MKISPRSTSLSSGASARGARFIGADGGDHAARHAFDKTRGLDLALEARVGEIGAEGVQARVEVGHTETMPRMDGMRQPRFYGGRRR